MYQGHCSDGSSIQKHSAGPLYPFVVYETHDGGVYLMLGCTTARVMDRQQAYEIVEATRFLHSEQRGAVSLEKAFRFHLNAFAHPFN